MADDVAINSSQRKAGMVILIPLGNGRKRGHPFPSCLSFPVFSGSSLVRMHMHIPTSTTTAPQKGGKVSKSYSLSFILGLDELFDSYPHM
jgi:hypothetical protein